MTQPGGSARRYFRAMARCLSESPTEAVAAWVGDRRKTDLARRELETLRSVSPFESDRLTDGLVETLLRFMRTPTSFGSGARSWLGLGEVIRAAETILTVDAECFDILYALVDTCASPALMLKGIGFRRNRLAVPGPQARAIQELSAFHRAIEGASPALLCSLTTLFREGDTGELSASPALKKDPLTRAIQLVLGELDPIYVLSHRLGGDAQFLAERSAERSVSRFLSDRSRSEPAESGLRNALEYITGCEHFAWSLRGPERELPIQVHLARIDPDLENDQPVILMTESPGGDPSLYVARDVRAKGLGLKEYYVGEPCSRRSAWFEGPALCYGLSLQSTFGRRPDDRIRAYLTRLDIQARN
jgi:hypothetical protein